MLVICKRTVSPFFTVMVEGSKENCLAVIVNSFACGWDAGCGAVSGEDKSGGEDEGDSGNGWGSILPSQSDPSGAAESDPGETIFSSTVPGATPGAGVED